MYRALNTQLQDDGDTDDDVSISTETGTSKPTYLTTDTVMKGCWYIVTVTLTALHNVVTALNISKYTYIERHLPSGHTNRLLFCPWKKRK